MREGWTMVLIDCDVPLRCHYSCHGGSCAISETPLHVIWPLAVTEIWWRWLVHSPTVFGNGRTHSGGLEGSGGSRLANNWLRAFTCQPTQDSPQEEEFFGRQLKPAGQRSWLVDMGGFGHICLTYVWLCEWLQAKQWGVKIHHPPGRSCSLRTL